MPGTLIKELGWPGGFDGQRNTRIHPTREWINFSSPSFTTVVKDRYNYPERLPGYGSLYGTVTVTRMMGSFRQ